MPSLFFASEIVRSYTNNVYVTPRPVFSAPQIKPNSTAQKNQPTGVRKKAFNEEMRGYCTSSSRRRRERDCGHKERTRVLREPPPYVET